MNRTPSPPRPPWLFLPLLSLFVVTMLSPLPAQDEKPVPEPVDRNEEDPAKKERPNPFRQGDDSKKGATFDRFGRKTEAEMTKAQLAQEITENMKRIERLLDQRDTDRDTQSLQKATVAQIDRLIDMFKP